MSGASNVTFWLKAHGHEATEERVQRIFDYAKRTDHTLTREEIEALL
jgi:hypothetical protein